MDEYLIQWLEYLRVRSSLIAANQRARMFVLNAVYAFFIASIVYWAEGRHWYLGATGVLVAAGFIYGTLVVNLRDSQAQKVLNLLVERILARELTEPSRICSQLHQELKRSLSVSPRDYFAKTLKRELE